MFVLAHTLRERTIVLTRLNTAIKSKILNIRPSPETSYPELTLALSNQRSTKTLRRSRFAQTTSPGQILTGIEGFDAAQLLVKFPFSIA